MFVMLCWMRRNQRRLTDFADATNMHFVMDCATYRNVPSIFYTIAPLPRKSFNDQKDIKSKICISTGSWHYLNSSRRGEGM